MDKQDTIATCAKCNSISLQAMKKGFSGTNAVIGYLVGSLIAGFLWHSAVDSNDPQLIAFSWASLCLPFLGLFAGTLKMNQVIVFCMSCGHEEVYAELGSKPVQEVVAAE